MIGFHKYRMGRSKLFDCGCNVEIDISEYDNIGYRVYHSDGYCVEVFREEADSNEFDDLIDGCCYTFVGDLS